MMRRVRVVAVVLATLLAGSPASAIADRPGTGAYAVATIDPALRDELAVAGSGRMVAALVSLASQLDPATIAARTRRLRHAAIVRALRANASTTQAGVLELLAQRRRQGLVARVDPLWIFNGVAVSAVPSVIRELAARPDVRMVISDQAVTMPAPPAHARPAHARARSAPPNATQPPPRPQPQPQPRPQPNIALVNAPQLWALGLRGQGVVVANVDTGVDVSHPDLAGRWRGGTNSWYDPNGEHPTVPTDVHGHGTSTMGVMVGGDAGGTAIGMAPGATWIAAKAFNDRGTATLTSIHRSLQWLLDPDGNPDTADAPDVVNNSWTQSTAGCHLDFHHDLANLRAAGILPVFSAGNYGPLPGTVLSPANNPEAFAVGATDETDVLQPASSRGPSACGQTIAPQLVAPGVNVRTTDLYGCYTDGTGTSLAAPHVAGALALLLGAFPDLPAARQAAALQAGAQDRGGGPDNDTGYGRLDVLAAYRWLAASSLNGK